MSNGSYPPEDYRQGEQLGRGRGPAPGWGEGQGYGAHQGRGGQSGGGAQAGGQHPPPPPAGPPGPAPGYGAPQQPGGYGPPQGPGGYGTGGYGTPYGGPPGPGGPYDGPSKGLSGKAWAAIGGGVFALLVVIVVAVVSVVVLAGPDRTVATPASIDGLQQVTDPELQQRAAQLRQQVRQQASSGGIQLDKTVAAFYRGQSATNLNLPPTNLMLFFGGAGSFSDPQQALQSMLEGGIAQYGGGTPRPYPAGELGGSVACVQGQRVGRPFSVCGWATHDTFGLVIPAGPQTSPETAQLLKRVRPAVVREKN